MRAAGGELPASANVQTPQELPYRPGLHSHGGLHRLPEWCLCGEVPRVDTSCQCACRTVPISARQGNRSDCGRVSDKFGIFVSRAPTLLVEVGGCGSYAPPVGSATWVARDAASNFDSAPGQIMAVHLVQPRTLSQCEFDGRRGPSRTYSCSMKETCGPARFLHCSASWRHRRYLSFVL
ncbi:MAG: hypothetical protein K0Q89_2096 [Thermomicrobiales bacterium]|nr:hypothetical protein [Thermomicrobiales bacterium]